LTKKKRYWKWLLCCVFLCVTQYSFSQRILDSTGRTIVADTTNPSVPTDSLSKVAEPVKDKKVDSVLKVHSPRKAIIRSAIIPGWGQIYNKKYWKLPLVYGALGGTAYVFFDNLQVYKDSRFAYKAKYQASRGDSSLLPGVKPEYMVYSLESLRANRDQFRKYIDYSVLFFVFFWGLNVVDAAVDAHLKSFDVSPDLSLLIKPGYSEMAGTKGISIILAFK
jgi:Family of unknown function (DUF5683)